MTASIPIVIKDNENIIRSTLSSIQLQKDIDFEVIVIDDNSSDYSAEIVYNEFCKKDHRIKLFSNICRGSLDAYNTANRLCTGDYIFKIYPGMILNKNYMQAFLAYMEHNPHISAVSSRVIYKKMAAAGYMEDDSSTYVPSILEIDQFNNDNSLIVNKFDIWTLYATCFKREAMLKYDIQARSANAPAYTFWTDFWSNSCNMAIISSTMMAFFLNCGNNVENIVLDNEVKYYIETACERYMQRTGRLISYGGNTE